MTGIELWVVSFGSDRSTNWAPTFEQIQSSMLYNFFEENYISTELRTWKKFALMLAPAQRW